MGIRLAVKDLFDTAGLVTTYGSILFARARARRETAEAVRGSRPPATSTSARRTCTSSRTGRPPRTRTSGRCRTRSRRAASRAARAAARRRRSRRGWPTPRSAPTRAARSGSPPPAAASSASSRRYGLVPIDGCFPLAPSFDHAGPMARDVAGCGEMMEALAPGFEPRSVELGGRRGRRRLARARGPTRARARRGRRRAVPRDARPRAARSPTRSVPPSWARWPTSTASSSLEHAELVRRERPHEGRALPRAERRRVTSRGRRARALPRAAGRGCGRASTCVLTPTLGLRRSARSPSTSSRSATRLISLTLPVQRDRLAGARAALRARRGRPPRLRAARGSAGRGRRSCWRPAQRWSGLCPSIDVTRTSE